MDDTNLFSLENLNNKPEYNFLSQLNNDDNNYDYPYNNDIKCSFIDVNSFCKTYVNEKRLSFMCINIQSLPAKFNEFTDLISQ